VSERERERDTEIQRYRDTEREIGRKERLREGEGGWQTAHGCQEKNEICTGS
jgi:hypothetical protein